MKLLILVLCLGCCPPVYYNVDCRRSNGVVIYQGPVDRYVSGWGWLKYKIGTSWTTIHKPDVCTVTRTKG